MVGEHPDRVEGETGDHYVVIARRYRPQTFTDLVGQEQVARALGNAIATNRVGHAYLFTGSRGIGKTSTARIFAKALNCEQGPSSEPCNECDICRSISSGEDVDVLEIDGASNRGIDEIRQLRSNVTIRPSRARYKIYIIDEVHMLTTAAFNALLKTLEEPPPHVKFIFCTTDPEKVPITVLSRCQRFDFSPVGIPAIVSRLQQIVANEGVAADEDALRLLARRAAGSLRDSQSLLEQVLSFCGDRLTSADVHQLLGTAQSGLLDTLVDKLTARDAAAAMAEADRAVAEGVDAGRLTEQLLGYFRDMMTASIGCQADLLLYAEAADHAQLAERGKQWGLSSLLAAIQLLDHTLTRMRQSTHSRTLLEIALVRLCQLDQLADLGRLLEQLPQTGETSSAAAPSAAPSKGATGEQKKTDEPTDSASSGPDRPTSVTALNEKTAESLWKQVLESLGDLTATHGSRYERVAISGPNQLAVSFPARYTLDKERCERPEAKARFEAALAQLTGQPVRLVFSVVSHGPEPTPRRPVLTRLQRLRQTEQHPFVRQAMELFDAEVTDLQEPRPSDD